MKVPLDGGTPTTLASAAFSHLVLRDRRRRRHLLANTMIMAIPIWRDASHSCQTRQTFRMAWTRQTSTGPGYPRDHGRPDRRRALFTFASHQFPMAVAVDDHVLGAFKAR
jgi:hypothetical protein